MRQIGEAIFAYANSNGGQFPSRLSDLVLTQGVPTKIFVCPDSIDTPAEGATPEARAAAMATPGHVSYIYVPNLSTKSRTDAILLYEPASDHGDIVNVMFADGHTECIFTKIWLGMVAELHAGFNPPRPGHY